MAILNIGPALTQQAIRDLLMDFQETIDSLTQKDKRIMGVLATLVDADLVALGFTEAEVTEIRTGMAGYDQFVQQGQSNATLTAFANTIRRV